MYQAYWERPLGAPLSTPNYGPLYRRVEDMEPPLGHGAPLKHAPVTNPQEGLLPPVEVHDAGNGPKGAGPPNPIRFRQINAFVKTPSANSPLPYLLPQTFGFLELEERHTNFRTRRRDAQQLTRHFTKRSHSRARARARARARGRAGASESSGASGSSADSATSLPTKLTYDAKTGPRTIAEHLLGHRDVIRVPQSLRFDKFLKYQPYWHAHEHSRLYDFKFAPVYPPDLSKTLNDPRWPGWRRDETKLPLFAPKWSGSKYEEATRRQKMLLAKIREEQEHIGGTL